MTLEISKYHFGDARIQILISFSFDSNFTHFFHKSTISIRSESITNASLPGQWSKNLKKDVSHFEWNSTDLDVLKCMCNNTMDMVEHHHNHNQNVEWNIAVYGFYCLWLCVLCMHECTLYDDIMRLLHIRNISYAACRHAGMKLERTIVEWKKAAHTLNASSKLRIDNDCLPAHRHYSTQWHFILPSVIIMNISSCNYRCETILEKRSWSNKLTISNTPPSTRDEIKRERKKRTQTHYGITITVCSMYLRISACVPARTHRHMHVCAFVHLFRSF